MELQRVKAVSGAAAEKGIDGKAERGKGKQWSLRFLELLVREFEEEERRGKHEEKHRPEKKEGKEESQTEDEYEYDRRIVVKGEESVPEDWDSFEVTRDFTEPVLTSELYEDIIDQVKSVGNWRANILYKIAGTIMQDYYTNALDMRAVGELFWGCYQKCVEKNRQIAASKEKKQEILATLYEYFSRVNARKSVAANEREGRKLVEGCGLPWAGTTYYASEYYYTCGKMQRLFRKKCREIARKETLAEVSFTGIERTTQFFHVGGLSFHTVFVWVQQKDNHPGNQYGMRELKRVPPRHFTYLYRNHFAESETCQIQLLETRMKREAETEKRIWRSFTVKDGREYHNGMSYLLEGSMMDEVDETVYGEAMGFLQNFILYRVSGCVEFLLIEGNDISKNSGKVSENVI